MSKRYEVAVIDRIVDGRHAVLIVGNPPNREITVPVDQLPVDATDGTWLQVEFSGEWLVSAAIDYEATAQARARVRGKLQALRGRGRREDR